MAGNKIGGQRAAATNKARFGEDFYSKIGKKGGSAEHTSPRGFASMEFAKRREIGIKGGKASAKKRWNFEE